MKYLNTGIKKTNYVSIAYTHARAHVNTHTHKYYKSISDTVFKCYTNSIIYSLLLRKIKRVT